MAVNIKPDYYRLLDVSRNSDSAKIESAYRNYLEKLESDPWNPSRELDREEGTRAYLTLSSPESREEYDKTLNYEFLLLDTTKIPEEFESFYNVQKLSEEEETKEFYSRFLEFKKDLETTLKNLRITVLFFLSAFLFLTIFALSMALAQKNGFLSPDVELFYRKWGILYSTGILFSGYAIFRKILNTKKNKFGRNREH
ncbi:J domain-containing protein [Leptospira santarosai]|uniref:DnaJ domain protein n=1 Tax=Leptospira santarosai serovar Arenal str. MAVJ 401 TaxID=1049976 RepID=M6JU64_9LEPT|nr:DnaJ domain-containing protein [Leptospira santarosai]EMN23135.1 DnaJ domain protein [Leptospira santarosai serovar Arenal str. MAVJ 401]AVV51115.1 DnaJ domain protein [Leptospira santarosai]EMF90966.1 DnaJ domain protein [Leptospira santarosai str. ST188]EMO70132.1 DnaJ domain protein [Leptospira santarosai str. 200403458]EMO97101.1 DnaJ domain protein [Leptospira santarosai str. 200702252]